MKLRFAILLFFWTTCEAFTVSPLLTTTTTKAACPRTQRNKVPMLLYMTTTSNTPNFSSTDPFQILGIDPTADTQTIKRAYKKLALKYHPDMATTKDSTSEQKRIASDQFAKINAAYEALSGKTGRGTSNTSTTSSSSSSNAWTPPHRRTSASGPSRTSSSTDWRDYIPYSSVEDQKYDTGGDSFAAIFADLLAGAAASTSRRGGGGGGGGVFRDFVEFLEQTIDGYSTTGSSSTSTSSSQDDADLQYLLQTGTIREVGDEMDETELVLKQLTKKLERLDIELIQLQADIAVTTKFTEKLDLEEAMDELRARKRVVENYIQKARKRLLALQTRYKVLVTRGANDPKAGGKSSRTTTVDTTTNNQSVNASSTKSAPSPPNQQQHQPNTNTKEEDSWKDERFGSFGRGRGSSRRRAQRNAYDTTSSTTSTSTDQTYYSSTTDQNNASSSKRSSYEASQSQTSPSSSSTNSFNYVPPHRRTPGSSTTQDDKRRLRELKVEKEFEKLKRDLGL